MKTNGLKIGIMGVAGSGKDTVGNIIKDITGYEIVSFAKPLHDAVRHIWGESALLRENKETEQIFGEGTFDYFYSYHVKLLNDFAMRFNLFTEIGFLPTLKIREVFSDNRGRIFETISPRKFMQIYGTEYWRSIKGDIFVANIESNKNNVIITDVRFMNEASICDVLIVLLRDCEEVNTHGSEELAKKFANREVISEEEQLLNMGRSVFIIDNNGTLDELKLKINSIIEQGINLT